MWCLERNIHITAQHLPGVMNHIADAESRTMRDRLDWKLNPVIFWNINGSGSICFQTDNSVPRLFQLASESLRSGYRCLPAGMVAIEGLCQPPMVPNREVLAQVQTQWTRIVLLAPVWKTQPWYPFLLSMAVGCLYIYQGGRCKSWTLDSGLDHGLDYGLEYGLNSRLIFKLLAMVTSQDLD